MWETLPSGLIIPVGTMTEISDHVKTTFLTIKAKAKEIEALYRNSGIELPRTCDLCQLMENAKLYWENWFIVQPDKLDMAMLFRTLHLDRIATNILLLKDMEGKGKYLKAFASGSLDFFKREKSLAKDLLWEIEVWAPLRRKFQSVSLEEPPDIVIRFDDAKIGIACKKLYSEKHVQNILSEAVSQLANSFDFGIVAINIDDLHPPDKVVRASDHKGMSEFIQNLNGHFIEKHERHFRKYLASGRLISAMVSTNAIVDVQTETPRYNNTSEWTIWTIPGLSADQDKQLRRFYGIVTG